MKHYPYYILLLFVSIFSSCTKDYYFDHSYPITNEEWTYQQPVSFEVDITDTQKKYNLYFDIDHSTMYRYQNLYVQIHTTFPDGKKLSKPLSIDFMSNQGRWYGKCSGEQCKLRVAMQTNAKFEAQGKYTFTFEQFMRTEKLKGIENLAFRVEAVGGN